jgi:hypothetical protein
VPDLSTDDRFEEIKRLLDSTVSEFQSLFESAGGFEDSRVGNGWNPDSIEPEIHFLESKPPQELMSIAQARKRALFQNRLVSFMKPREQDVALVGQPILKLVPFWLIKGFHECFYFRGNSYKIDLPNDVVAVEVEGKIRDLVGHETTDSLRIAGLTRRLLGKRDLSGVKAFRLNDVTELAYMYNEGSYFVNSEGEEDLEAEAFFERRLPLQKISLHELSTRFPDAELVKSSVSKQDLIRKLHTAIVKPPIAFSKILSNRFQITTLAEYLMPVYSFIFQWQGQKKQLSVHGFTGGVFQ